jgi:(2R)-3-sulfolactate dehydrogenase (NADP+)
MPRLDAKALEALAAAALTRAGASEAAAASTARALVAAEAQGLAGHGLSRVPQYVAQLGNGRIARDAEPKIIASRGGAFLVDAGEGLAYPACDLALAEARARIANHGVVFAGITNSHHFGAAAVHLQAAAEAGLVGLAFSNSPAGLTAWGGKKPLFGTNPIAAVFPRRGAPPVVVDLSLSQVARGKLMVAAREGREIPLGWAVDSEGLPTTDPKKGLAGAMAPAGGVKGAALALVVELLVTTLTGAAFGFEADSFFVEEGNRPRLGQAFLLIDPGALAGTDSYFARIEVLIAAILADDGVRLPGARRQALEASAQAEGLELADGVLSPLRELAGV